VFVDIPINIRAPMLKNHTYLFNVMDIHL